MSDRKNNLIIAICALATGVATYHYLNQRKNLTALSQDKAVEIIERETNQRPKTDTELQQSAIRNISSEDKSELQKQQLKLNTFAKNQFTDSSQMIAEVSVLSLEILKSSLPMEKKSELSADLHRIASQKMAKINPPKVVDTRLDLKDNIIYPVFETK